MTSKLFCRVKRKIAKIKALIVYWRFSALLFGEAAMLNAFIVSKEVSKATVSFFRIEIPKMRIARAHLMVFELFYNTSFVFWKLA